MTTTAKVCALILAAGYSSRMGAFKPLLPVANATVLEEAISRFTEAGIRDMRVVVGHQAEAITPLLERLGIPWVANEQYERGMLSSVMAGVRSLDPWVEAFFLLPVDIPLVKPKTLRELCEAYGNGGSKIIYPCFRGVRGHPPLIATTCLPKDLSSDYAGGLRAFLAQYDHLARDLEVADQGTVMDCDTPADYEKLQAYGMREDIPTEKECQALWVQFGVPAKVIDHSRVVGQLARLLAVHLRMAGMELNLDLIVAAGYLHDLAKGGPDHAREGSRVLAALGYPRVAEIVASHMDILPATGSLTESNLIYLADKLVDGDQLMSLEDHFGKTERRFADSSEIRKAVRKRLNHAQLIRRAVEKRLGQPLSQIMQRFERNLGAVSHGGPRDIYLIRHGAVPLEGSKKRFVGQLDLPLSSDGIAQVQGLCEELRDIRFTTVFCSDLKRSVATAAILTADRPGVTVLQRPELREIDLGEWEGLSFEEVKGAYPEEFQKRGRDIVHYQPPGGESFFDCTKRVIPAFYSLLHASRGNILLVGHAGVNRIVLCQVLGKSLAELFDIGQGYACLNLIHYEDGTFTAKVLNGKVV